MKNFMKTTRLVLAVTTLLAADSIAGTQERLQHHEKVFNAFKPPSEFFVLAGPKQVVRGRAATQG